MLVNIQIPDELYQRYAERRPERPQTALAEALKEFVELVPGKRRMVLDEATLRELVGILQTTLESPADLVAAIRRERRVGLGDGVQLELSEGQRARLKAMALAMKHPSADPEQHFREFVAREVGRALNVAVGS